MDFLSWFWGVRQDTLEETQPASQDETQPACQGCGSHEQPENHYGLRLCEGCRNCFRRQSKHMCKEWFLEDLRPVDEVTFKTHLTAKNRDRLYAMYCAGVQPTKHLFKKVFKCFYFLFPLPLIFSCSNSLFCTNPLDAIDI
eukprot:m.207334 g.207334  ORF g.207334 m.207334 type:complete len:141 (+) comp26072_c0_seq42:1538-1960(+)